MSLNFNRLTFASFSLLLVALLFLLPGLGCGGGNDATVSGEITYNGEKLTGGSGQVVFQKVGSPGKVYTGAITADSRYELNETRNVSGALSGEYNVSIKYSELDTMPPKSLIPVKYVSPKTSGLTATLTSGSNEIDFPLTD